MTVTTIYHCAPGLVAPYAMRSLMVALGTIDGLGLVVGPAGLL